MKIELSMQNNADTTMRIEICLQIMRFKKFVCRKLGQIVGQILKKEGSARKKKLELQNPRSTRGVRVEGERNAGGRSRSRRAVVR